MRQQQSIVAFLCTVGLRRHRVEVEDIAGLTLECPAKRIQCRKTHRSCLTSLENGEIGEGDSDPLTEFRQRHVAVGKNPVESHVDAHDASDGQVRFFTQQRSLSEYLRQDQHHEDQEPAHQVYWVVQTMWKGHGGGGGDRPR